MTTACSSLAEELSGAGSGEAAEAMLAALWTSVVCRHETNELDTVYAVLFGTHTMTRLRLRGLMVLTDCFSDSSSNATASASLRLVTRGEAA